MHAPCEGIEDVAAAVVLQLETTLLRLVVSPAGGEESVLGVVSM